MSSALQSLTQDENLISEEKILKGPLPQHIAIIMDGNGRWAMRQGMPRLMGHHRGAEALRRTIEACNEIGIRYLTVFAFSTENWRRPAEEVSGLMALLKCYLKSELAEAHRNNLRIRVIGDRTRAGQEILMLMEHAVTLTQQNTGLNLTIAFDYGGRDEIVKASRCLADQVKKGILQPEEINEELFARFLFTHDLPDPDLFIRTSDVSRISNFLIWQTAYTELVFLDVYWPDFSRKDLLHAIAHFQKCERKFGKISAHQECC
jgi:undecaprenyl diphosphate synthase